MEKMMKTEMMTLKVEADLKQAFQAIAERNHRPASQIIRDLMRNYVSLNREPNDLTVKTMQQSEKGEDLHSAKDFDDLCKQLGI